MRKRFVGSSCLLNIPVGCVEPIFVVLESKAIWPGN